MKTFVLLIFVCLVIATGIKSLKNPTVTAMEEKKMKTQEMINQIQG